MAEKQIIKTDMAPKAIGPYSVANRAGDWVFTATLPASFNCIFYFLVAAAMTFLTLILMGCVYVREGSSRMRIWFRNVAAECTVGRHAEHIMHGGGQTCITVVDKWVYRSSIVAGCTVIKGIRNRDSVSGGTANKVDWFVSSIMTCIAFLHVMQTG